jgi:hypothetical protein
LKASAEFVFDESGKIAIEWDSKLVKCGVPEVRYKNEILSLVALAGLKTEVVTHE